MRGRRKSKNRRKEALLTKQEGFVEWSGKRKGKKERTEAGIEGNGGKQRKPPSGGPSPQWDTTLEELIITLCQDLRVKGQSQVDSFYGGRHSLPLLLCGQIILMKAFFLTLV